MIVVTVLVAVPQPCAIWQGLAFSLVRVTVQVVPFSTVVVDHTDVNGNPRAPG